jgi:CheY-like chemotaxis protein
MSGMTTGRRALIVDDSRSARVILSRMLEQHGLAVDTAETAEQALEYLQQNRPDVIFMDHLMPGMDGFEAVQTIKGNPQTATIPLMMYTSQEGELYVSQARALGAMGVLPKTVRPADVSRVLYQLHLLPDRRQGRSALFREAAVLDATPAAEPAHEAGETAADTTVPHPEALAASPLALTELQASLRQSMQQLVKDQLAEQRRFMLATFEAFARRLNGEIKEGISKIPAPTVVEPMLPPPPRRQWWPALITALLATVPALVLGYLYLRQSEANLELAGELERAQAAAVAAATLAEARRPAPQAAPVSPPPTASSGPSAGGVSAVEFVPYGEAPFAGRRLERLRGIADALADEGFRGRIRLESFVGDFCLTGDPATGFSVAEASLPSRGCDLVGNPFEDALPSAQRQSVAFANFAAILRQRTGGAIEVEVASAGRGDPIAYPEQGEDTTAGEWNAIAAQNNRVEYRLVPADE